MKITIETPIRADIATVWAAFNDPKDIVCWDASDEWHTTRAANDLRVGGALSLHIEAKKDDAPNDNSFDLVAPYTRVEAPHLLEFWMDATHSVLVAFIETDNGVIVRQSFDAESTPSIEEQRAEWQGVLDRFGRYVEKKVEGNCCELGVVH